MLTVDQQLAKAPEKSPALDSVWLDQLMARLEQISLEEAEHQTKRVEQFCAGEITWAELQGFTPEDLVEVAEIGYTQLQLGQLKKAEIVFRALTYLDHTQSYYHTMMGVVYQRLDRWVDALAEYGVALEMDPTDVTAYTNRGEIYYEIGYVEDAAANFQKAIALDPKGSNSWANRARSLLKKMLEEQSEE